MTAPQKTGPRRDQHRTMHRYWKRAGVTHRGDRLALTSAIVHTEISSSSELTEAQADRVIAYQRDLYRDGLLAERAGQWLRARRHVIQKAGVDG